jgi:hypothetical protein
MEDTPVYGDSRTAPLPASPMRARGIQERSESDEVADRSVLDSDQLGVRFPSQIELAKDGFANDGLPPPAGGCLVHTNPLLFLRVVFCLARFTTLRI